MYHFHFPHLSFLQSYFHISTIYYFQNLLFPQYFIWCHISTIISHQGLSISIVFLTIFHNAWKYVLQYYHKSRGEFPQIENVSFPLSTSLHICSHISTFPQFTLSTIFYFHNLLFPQYFIWCQISTIYPIRAFLLALFSRQSSTIHENLYYNIITNQEPNFHKLKMYHLHFPHLYISAIIFPHFHNLLFPQFTISTIFYLMPDFHNYIPSGPLYSRCFTENLPQFRKIFRDLGSRDRALFQLCHTLTRSIWPAHFVKGLHRVLLTTHK